MKLRKLVTKDWVHVSPELISGGGGKYWETDQIGCTFLGDCCWEVQMWKNGGDHKKEKFFKNDSVEAVISFK